MLDSLTSFARSLKINHAHKKMKNKKADIQISFNMIFSIILIIVFIVTATYVIKKFINTSQCSQIGIFKNDLQNEIDKAWASTGESVYSKSFDIPSKITYICFADKNKTYTGTYKDYARDFKYSNPGNNFFFVPMKNACDFKTLTIKHIDIKKTTSSINPYCIPVKNGKVDVRIVKGITDSLVCIGDSC